MPLNRDMDILKHIIDYCNEIDHTMDTFGRDTNNFSDNTIYQNATALCVLQIGELTTHFSDEFRDTYNKVPWSQIRGMRNVVANHYGKIDKETLWKTLNEDIPVLKEYCKTILKEMK
ncbi:MAG: DUF86 domain-containing protein [Clostridiales bacterium]|nr:DUF86 domain-containing protein [Clostridiales bacterium]